MAWILAIDAGNTVTRIAGMKGKEVLAVGRLPSQDSHFCCVFRHLAKQVQSRLGCPPEAVGISSVVPSLTPLLQGEASLTGAPLMVVGSETTAGMELDYQPPESLGADRIANAVAASQEYGAPCVAVDLGTALTLDAVDRNGVFQGGLLFPGVTAARGVFGQATAQVRPDSAIAKPTVIGKTTQEGVANGLAYGYPALIEGLLGDLRKELGGSARAVVTGGGQRHLARWPSGMDGRDSHLTLRGVAAVARKWKRGEA